MKASFLNKQRQMKQLRQQLLEGEARRVHCKMAAGARRASSDDGDADEQREEPAAMQGM